MLGKFQNVDASLDYSKIIKNAMISHCKQVSPHKYAAAAALLQGDMWDRVIAHYRKVITKSKGPNGAIGRMSYRELKGKFSEIAMQSGMGMLRGNADRYHGIIYRLVNQGHGISLHKIASPQNHTFWLILK